MATFKIRDLMVALRPGLETPKRPGPLDICEITCETFLAGDSEGCGDCTDSCGDTCDCTDTCGDTCGGCTETCGGCTDSCGACTNCTGTCGCTQTCGQCSVAHTNVCGACTQCTGGCTATCKACTHVHTVICQHGTICRLATCAGTCMNKTCGASLKQSPNISGMNAQALARLKDQLRTTMQQVGRREQALAARVEANAIEPKTVEQFDALETKLTEALEELRARRTQLQKGESK
jgi:hypothetical protein